jgi:hypothetical protein
LPKWETFGLNFCSISVRRTDRKQTNKQTNKNETNKQASKKKKKPLT